MSPIEKRVLLEALRLPQVARAALAGHLIESLDRRVDEDAESAWSSEIARRVKAIDAGMAKLVPWTQVRRRILGERRGPSRA